MPAGTLYLIPTLLGGMSPELAIPAAAAAMVGKLDYFVAENPKSARAFLKLIGIARPLQEIDIAKLDVNTPEAALGALLQPILDGRDGALLSEAGAPAVADPGALLIRLAHQREIRVAPLVGPSAILLALMACGLDGQRFAFHGYLPKDETALAGKLKDLEKLSASRRETQIFIETPYRNDRLLAALIRHCAPATLLCVASDLTLGSESVAMRPVAEWEKKRVEIGRRPSVFLLLAQGKR